MPSLFYMLAVTQTQISPKGLPNRNAAGTDDLQTVLAIVFGIVGALALLVIVISGFRYVLAAGDPQKMSKAKNGIVYAIVGLAIAITAQAIIAFVVGRI